MKVKQRGSAWSIKLVFNLYRLFGYMFIYYLMYPVSYFYRWKATNVKEALAIYYEKINKDFNAKVLHEHLRHFAICMCDRFISLVAPKDYEFAVEERKKLEKELSEGGILLMSHFGGWASAAHCFGKIDIKINVVMQEVLMQGIKDIEDSIKSDDRSKLNIIDTAKGGIAMTLEIAKALSNDELVAMMADRATNTKHNKGVEFFGSVGYFNKNPFEIAYKTNKPLIALFIRFESPQKYKIDYIKLDMEKEKSMDEEVGRCMREYAKRFEENIKIYPQGWFNFYNFWELES